MLLAFFVGFITAILCVIGGLVYAFNALNTKVASSVRQAAADRAAVDMRREVDAATVLDPVKIISKVQFGTFDGVRAEPPMSYHSSGGTSSSSHNPSAAQHGGGGGGSSGPSYDPYAWNHDRVAGRTIRYGRITLVGSVISVYETVVVDRNGTQRPIKDKLKLRKESIISSALGGAGGGGGSGSGGTTSSSGNGGGGVGAAVAGVAGGVVGMLTGADIRSGEPATERLVGKIPISRLNVRIESISDSPHPVAGTASVQYRYLVLEREMSAADALSASTTSAPASGGGGGVAGVLDPTMDFSDEADTVPNWADRREDPRRIHLLQGAPLFTLHGARPDNRRGVKTQTVGGGRSGGPHASGGAATASGDVTVDLASYGHHEATPIRWRTIMIRFATVRELERWYDVLRPSVVTNQWKVFLKSLPQVDVLNVLLSRIFFENRELKELNDIVTQKVNKALAKVVFPPTMSRSRAMASEVNVGGELPIISNISPLATSACGEIAFDVDVWYRGGFTLKFLIDLVLATDTKSLLKLDFKAPSLEATVHVKELRGRLHLSIGAPPSHKMWLGFHELPEVVVELDLQLVKNENTGTLARLVMNAIPDLSEVLTNVVREKLFEDMTLPHLDDFPVPNVEKTPPASPRAENDPRNNPFAEVVVLAPAPTSGEGLRRRH